MKALIIGLGQAGGKIADLFIKEDRKSPVPHTFEAIAINTAIADLLSLKYIPKDNRLLIGETFVKGHGVGTNNQLAAEIARREIDIILGKIAKMDISTIDAFILIAGLGGGTGSGSIPVIASKLKEIYDEPVFAIGILPAKSEGALFAYNAARSLLSLLKSCDAIILVDNDAFIRPGENLRDAYERINMEIVKRVSLLCRAGEIRRRNMIGEKVIDASDIFNTLRTNSKYASLATIGYAAEKVKSRGFLSRLFRKDDYQVGRASRILSVAKRSVMGKLLIPCDYKSAEKALMLFLGPPEELDRVGIERARSWLEETLNTKEVRAGDYPQPGVKQVACVTLLSNIRRIPRIDELLKLASEARKKIEEEKENNIYETFKKYNIEEL